MRLIQLKKDSLRSLRGQAILVFCTYIATVCLGASAVCFRTALREWLRTPVFAPPSQRVRELSNGIASGRMDVLQVTQLTDAELDAVYGTFVNDQIDDPKHLLLGALFQYRERELCQRIRITCVTGNPKQRVRAVALFQNARSAGRRAEILRLAVYVFQRANRCGDIETAHRLKHFIEVLKADDPRRGKQVPE